MYSKTIHNPIHYYSERCNFPLEFLDVRLLAFAAVVHSAALLIDIIIISKIYNIKYIRE